MAGSSPICNVCRRHWCEIILVAILAVTPLALFAAFAAQYYVSDVAALGWYLLWVLVWLAGVVVSGIIQNQKAKVSGHCPFVRLVVGHSAVLLAATLTLGEERVTRILSCAAWNDCAVLDWHLWAPLVILVFGFACLVISRSAALTNLCILYVYFILLVAWLLAGYSFFYNTEESIDNSVAEADRALADARGSNATTLVGFGMASGALAEMATSHAEMLFEYDCHGTELSLCVQLGVECSKSYVQPLCHGFILLSTAPLVAAGGGAPVALGFGTHVGLYEDRLTRNLALAEQKREQLGAPGVEGQLWAINVQHSRTGQKFWDEAQRRTLSSAEEAVGIFDADGVGRRLMWSALDHWADVAIKQGFKAVTEGKKVPTFWLVPKRAQEAWRVQRRWAYWQGIAAAIVTGIIAIAAAMYYILLRATLLSGMQQGFLRGHYWDIVPRSRGIELEEEDELETNSFDDVEHERTDASIFHERTDTSIFQDVE